MLLETIAIALTAAHFGTPLLYYWRAKKWLKRPWDIAPDPTYRPHVTVIVPTYNEAPLVEEKLDNIYEQDYRSPESGRFRFIRVRHPRAHYGLSEPPHRGSSTDLGSSESLNKFIHR